MIGNQLFRNEADGILWRCITVSEVPSIPKACHNNAYDGHLSEQMTGQKIFRACYFWPTLSQDLHLYVKKCDAYQRYAKNDLRMELPLHVSLPLIPFEKWGIDNVEEVHPHFSKGMAYIVVATEYLTKWAKVKAVRMDTAKNTTIFLYENTITRFGCPKILMSDRGTHFFNDMIQEMMDWFQIDH